MSNGYESNENENGRKFTRRNVDKFNETSMSNTES